MDRRPGRDSRGLLIIRGFPDDDGSDDAIYVEFGEPQQYCMEGGIESVRSALGKFRIQFTEEGAEKMAGIRIIEVDYDETDDEVPELLEALDYIFKGFGE